MKILFYSNVFFYLATVIAYTLEDGVFLGLTFQFFFGIIQLIYFLICRGRENSEKIKSYLNLYIALAGMMILTIASLFKFLHFEKSITLILISFIPMLIASYFVYITYLIQKQ
ncbi:hypothetical protein WNY78_09555 [Psychroserpens sp. AS72]|uniref:hypothetical protein n=1 Tax=Psychroserpens sp. AS72 TaxID=3135775 RepID=UPI003176376C